LAGLYGQMRSGIGGVQRVFEILDAHPDIQGSPNAESLSLMVRGQVSFKNVSFSYDGRVPVLQNVSLDIYVGEILALVGPSGAGISTIFNFFPGLYGPTEDLIRLDGQDLRSLASLNWGDSIC
jgi:ABC-type multidrug transport system fused ATPase/permease subunit